jgi:hypothetical protein
MGKKDSKGMRIDGIDDGNDMDDGKDELGGDGDNFGSKKKFSEMENMS